MEYPHWIIWDETWECNLVTLVKNNNPIQHEKQFIFEQF